MELHKLISEAYSHIIKNLPEASPRTLNIRGCNAKKWEQRYLNIEIHKWEKENSSHEVRRPLKSIKTVSVHNERKDQRNPYQAKINYFQAAIKNSQINVNLAERSKENNRNKLKFYDEKGK